MNDQINAIRTAVNDLEKQISDLTFRNGQLEHLLDTIASRDWEALAEKNPGQAFLYVSYLVKQLLESRP